MTVEAATPADLHGRLELAEAGTIVGEVAAGIDIVGSVHEVGGHSFRAYEGDVGEGGRGERRCRGTIGVVVALEAVALALVGNAGVTHGKAELHLAAEAVVGVEVVIPAVEGHQVLAVHRTAEPLVRVVVGVAHLHVVNLCAAAHAAEGEAVDFLVSLKGITGKFNAHVG